MTRIEIIKIARQLKAGETTDIPHHEMTDAVRQDNPKNAHYVLTNQDMRKFAQGISKQCGVLVSEDFDNHMWIIRSKKILPPPTYKEVLESLGLEGVSCQ